MIHAFGPGRECLTLTEVAQLTGLTRTGARQLLLTLVELVVLTERRRRDPGELRAILAKVRAEGFALVGQELADGLTLLALSIRGPPARSSRR